MAPSDAVGLLGGLLLLVQPGHDQILRFMALKQAREATGSPAPNLRELLRNAVDKRRNEFSGLDSLATALGGFAIVACFGLKLADL